MSITGENAQPRATVTSPAAPEAAGPSSDRLDWQSELDSAMADLDSRLSHPRRRASDTGAQPTLPQLGPIDITGELLDEIAWRVSQQMRRNQPATVPMEHAARAAVPPAAMAPPPIVDVPPRLAPGVALTIRVRRPLFRVRWRFWKKSRRRQAMISFADYRVS
jgi:hypothetical protein